MHRIGSLRSWAYRRPELVLLGVLAVPLVISLLRVAGTTWYPTGDYAHTELNLRAIPGHPPLIGVAGRFGPLEEQGSHPGPAMAYGLFPVYLVFGRTSLALLVSTTVVHLAAIAVAVLVARRVGGTSLAVLVAAGAALLDHSLGAQFFLTPWNPWMPALAYLAFLILVFAAVRARSWAVPAAVLAGTFCAQTHVSYMVLVHGMLGALVVWLLVAAWRRWQGIEWPAVRRSLLVGLGVGFVCWIPPLYDQLRRTGNLERLFRHFTGSTESTVGLRAATRALATQWNLGGAWLSGARHDPASSSPSLTGLLLFAAFVAGALVVSIRRRDAPALSLQAVALVAAALGWISTTRIIGDFYDYVIRWSWIVAAMLAISSGWAVWRAIADRAVTTGGIPAARRGLAVIAAALVLVPTVALVGQSAAVEVPYAIEGKLVGGLADGLAPKLDPYSRYLLRWHDPAGLGGPGFGLMLEMERRGFHFGSDSWTRFAVLDHRVYDESTVLAVLWLVTGDVSIDAFRARGDAEELVYFDPRTPAQAARSAEVRAQILDSLAALGRDDLISTIDSQYGNAAMIAASSELPPELNALVGEYTDLRLPGAVFQVAPGSPLFS